MTAQVVQFPDRSTILIDQIPFGGFEVEPWLCPAAAEKGRVFAAFVEAFEYAEQLAADVGTSIFLMCDVPGEESA